MRLSVDTSGKKFTDECGTFEFIEIVGEKNMAVAYVRDDSIYKGKGEAIAQKLVERFNAGEQRTLIVECSECGEKFSQVIDTYVPLTTDHYDEFCEECNRKASR